MTHNNNYKMTQNKNQEYSMMERQEYNYFSLETFKNLVDQEKKFIEQKNELDELHKNLTNAKSPSIKEALQKRIDEIAVSQVNVKFVVDDYLKNTIFQTTNGLIYMHVLNRDTDEIELISMSLSSFEKNYLSTMKTFNKSVLKSNTIRYDVGIYDRDFVVDKTKYLINIASPFNFSFKELKKDVMDKNKKDFDFVINFIKDIICNHQKESYHFLTKLISTYTHRKQSQVVLYLCGIGGTGKSMFLKILNGLLGQASRLMSDQVLSGSDMFNSSMIGSVLGYIEETSGKGEANYTDISRTIKRLSTEDSLPCRKMNTDQFFVKNMLNFVLLTNFVKDIINDRRNFVLEPSSEKMLDTEYFSKLNSILSNDNVMQMLFNHFYSIECNILDEKIPINEIMQDIKASKKLNRSEYDFLIDTFIRNDKETRTVFIMKDLYDMFVNYCQENNIKVFGSNEGIKISKSMIRQALINRGKKKDGYDTFSVDVEMMMKHFTNLGYTKEDFEKKQEQKVKLDEIFKVDHKQENERLTKENEELKKQIEELQKQLKGKTGGKKQKTEEIEEVETVEKVKCKKAKKILDDMEFE